MKKLLAAFFFVSFATYSQAIIADTQEQMLVEQFIYDDIAKNPISYQQAKPFIKYFTTDFATIFKSAIKAEAHYIKATPKDEKGCIADQEIFFANVEGVSAGKILSESGDENLKTINIRLAYIDNDRSDKTDFEVIKWDETVTLKKEKGKWLIDDIYDPKAKVSLKQNLTDYVKKGCNDI